MSKTLSELEADILAVLLKSIDLKLQWCEIKEILEKKYVPKYYDDTGTFRVILSRTLRKLKDNDFLGRKDKGHKQVFYYIQKIKEHKVREVLTNTLKSQELAPQFQDLIELASPEELQEITKNIFGFPQWELAESHIKGRFQSGERLSEKEQYYQPLDFVSAIHNIYTRKILRALKTQNTPTEILEIGEKIVARQPTTIFEDAVFLYYPTDLESAIQLLKYDLKNKQEGLESVPEFLEKHDRKFGMIYRQRYTELLGLDKNKPLTSEQLINIILDAKRESIRKAREETNV